MKKTSTVKATLLALVLAVIGVAGVTACDSDDDTVSAPAAFVSPVDGKTYCAWVENPSECPTTPGAPLPAPFPLPQDRPTQDPGMSNTDFLLMMALFNYHTTYSPWFGSPFYYNSFIGPAWVSHPGVYYGYGHRATVHITNVNNYTNTTSSFDKKYAADEKTNASKATYKTTSGKTYKGTQVPKNSFKGTNVTVKNGVVTPKSSGGGFKIGGSGGSKPYTGSGYKSGGGFSGGSRSSGSSGGRR